MPEGDGIVESYDRREYAQEKKQWLEKWADLITLHDLM
jgi:hypothetical protein